MSNALNIYQRINEIRKKVAYIQKDRAVSAGQGGNYKAVTHDAVTAKTRQAFIDNGVVIVPRQTAGEFDTPTQRWDSKAQMMVPSAMRLYRAKYELDFVNMDDPADKIPVSIEAHAMDNGDKAPGKALSYATKGAVLKLLNLETGEDDESRYQETPVEYIDSNKVDELTDMRGGVSDDFGDRFDAWMEKKGIVSFDQIPVDAYPPIAAQLKKGLASEDS